MLYEYIIIGKILVKVAIILSNTGHVIFRSHKVTKTSHPNRTDFTELTKIVSLLSGIKGY